MPDYAIQFPDIEDPQLTAAISAMVRTLVEALDFVLPLGGFDGITICRDYRTGLAMVERGELSGPAPEATRETFGTGIAMALWVERCGGLATHIVLDGAVGEALVGIDSEAAAAARFTLVHELGHVAEHTMAHAAFGKTVLQPFSDRYDSWLHERVRRCWSEYYVCRLTAEWAPGELAGFHKLLCGSLDALGAELLPETPHFEGLDVSKDTLVLSVVERISQVMTFSGQVIGHSHGCGRNSAAGSEADERLAALGLGDWFASLERALDRCYIAFCRAPRADMFRPLHRLFEAAFARMGG